MRTNLIVTGALALGLVASVGTADAAGGKDKKAAKVAAGKSGAAATKPGATAAAGASASAGAKVESFEQLREAARPAGNLGNLLEPLFAECKETGDFARRQCEQIRAWHMARIKGTKWFTVADASSLTSQPYDASTQSLTLSVNGCVACKEPPVVAGSPRLVATAAPKGFDEGAPVGLDVGSFDVTLPDPKKAAFWTEKVRPRLRVEFVFDVGAPFEGKTGKGVAVVRAGHRIFNTCTGEVLSSDPPSKDKVKLAGPRDPICPAADSPSDEDIEIAKDQATLPDTLTRQVIEKAMEPIRERVFECGETFEMKQGTARVRIVVAPDGKYTFTTDEPYDAGDIGLCVKQAVREAKFPRFKAVSPPVKINFPFYLRR